MDSIDSGDIPKAASMRVMTCAKGCCVVVVFFDAEEKPVYQGRLTHSGAVSVAYELVSMVNAGPVLARTPAAGSA
jgi:hypothetical protein